MMDSPPVKGFTLLHSLTPTILSIFGSTVGNLRTS